MIGWMRGTGPKPALTRCFAGSPKVSQNGQAACRHQTVVDCSQGKQRIRLSSLGVVPDEPSPPNGCRHYDRTEHRTLTRGSSRRACGSVQFLGQAETKNSESKREVEISSLRWIDYPNSIHRTIALGAISSFTRAPLLV